MNEIGDLRLMIADFQAPAAATPSPHGAFVPPAEGHPCSVLVDPLQRF